MRETITVRVAILASTFYLIESWRLISLHIDYPFYLHNMKYNFFLVFKLLTLRDLIIDIYNSGILKDIIIE